VEEVFDCWFESGSMPYAQCHYPFENKDNFEKTFPADFIAEGLDQTRGWFYTLLVLSTALFGKAPWKNLIVNGLVLAEDRKKMSKSARNYPDPMEVINEHSADAIRLYLINSPVVRAEPLAFKKEGVKEIVRDVLLPLWNVMKFFLQNYLRFKREGHEMPKELHPTNTMDRWILASSNHLIQYVVEEMRCYRLYTVVPGLLKYLDNLTNWYVRMNRRRLKGDGESPEECGQALATLYSVLMTAVHLMSPFIPFITESMYQRLAQLLPPEKREESVHYCLVPQADPTLLDPVIERKVERMQTVIELARVIRAQQNIALKMPVQKVIIIHHSQEYVDDVTELSEYVTGELNCLELEITTAERDYVRYSAEPNLGSLGKRLKAEAKNIGTEVRKWSHDDVKGFLSSKKATVLGHELGEEDIKVVKNFAPGIQDFLLHGDGQVLVMMDKTQSEQIFLKWLAREFVNRIQKLRKKAGLQPSDAIRVYFDNTESDEQITAAFAAEATYITDNVKYPCHNLKESKIETAEIIREEQELNQKRVVIVLARP
jgi:isoleucyl-tRNA synthetase